MARVALPPAPSSQAQGAGVARELLFRRSPATETVNQPQGSQAFFLFHASLCRIFRLAEHTPQWGAATSLPASATPARVPQRRVGFPGAVRGRRPGESAREDRRGSGRLAGKGGALLLPPGSSWDPR